MGRRIGEYQLGKLTGRYCVSWWEEDDKGERVRRRFRLQVDAGRPEAEGIAALNAFIRSREAAQATQTGDLTIGELFERYLDDLRKNGKSIDNRRWIWKSLEPKFGGLFPEDIPETRIVDGEARTVCHEWALEMARQGLARDTIWDRLACIRTVLNWAFKHNLIERVPHVWVPQKGAPRDMVWTGEDIEKLIEACSMPHVRLFVLIAAATGARKTAILQLTWDRVDFERRMIDFRVAKPKDILDAPESILVKRKQKGRSVVEFGDVLGIALMEAREAARSPFVVEWNGRQVLNIKKGLSAAIERAGLKMRGAGAHVIRHSAATWLADESVDMRKIQKMLGHRDMKTTETIYAKYSRGYLSEAANVIDLKLAKRKAG
jgi:integrase